jgi:hypothetical protein
MSSGASNCCVGIWDVFVPLGAALFVVACLGFAAFQLWLFRRRYEKGNDELDALRRRVKEAKYGQRGRSEEHLDNSANPNEPDVVN